MSHSTHSPALALPRDVSYRQPQNGSDSVKILGSVADALDGLPDSALRQALDFRAWELSGQSAAILGGFCSWVTWYGYDVAARMLVLVTAPDVAGEVVRADDPVLAMERHLQAVEDGAA